MEPEKHLNLTKIIVTLITRNARSKEKKDLSLSPKNVSSSKVTNVVKNEEKNDKDSSDDENNDFTNFLDQLQQNANENDNKVDDKNDNHNSNTEVTNTKVPVSNPDAVQLCKQAQTSHEKNIYLTFDDGPSRDITPQILDTLKEYNVPATFFVLGSRVELYPELVRREYNEGHFIANHGYSHSYSSIYSSVQSVIDEFNATNKAVQDALGTTEYNTLLFRFPGGSSGGPYNDLKAEAKRTLEGMGIPSTNWNCLTGDAEAVGRTKEQLLNRLYETAEGWDSLVVLMHDANDKQATADALPEIIEHYKNEGYTFKNYYDIFQ